MEVISVSRTALFRGSPNAAHARISINRAADFPVYGLQVQPRQADQSHDRGLGSRRRRSSSRPIEWKGSRATGTVQRVFLRTSCRMRYEVRSVAIGTKANDIASKAIPTLHTVANTETHREHSIKIECGTDDGRRFVDLSPSSSILGTQPLRPVGAKVFLHSDIAEDLCWASERGRLGFDWTNIRR
jgi:hypothetical protein